MKFDKKKLSTLIEKYQSELFKNLCELIDKMPVRTKDEGVQSHFVDLHLAVEKCLDDYIVTFMGPKFNLAKMRLEYEQKIYLARGIEYLFHFDNLYRGIILINKTRNKISHNLGSVLTDDDINAIWGILGISKFSRKALSGKIYGKEFDDFGALEKVVFLKLMLPVAMQSYTKLWKEWCKMKKFYLEQKEVIELVKKKIFTDIELLDN